MGFFCSMMVTFVGSCASELSRCSWVLSCQVGSETFSAFYSGFRYSEPSEASGVFSAPLCDRLAWVQVSERVAAKTALQMMRSWVFA